MSQLTEIVDCLVLALSVGSASFTIARTKVTAPFRKWTVAKSNWFGNLVSCPYCTSHWLAAIAVGIYRPRPVKLWEPVDWGVAWLMVVAVAAAVITVVAKATAPPPTPAKTFPEPYRPNPL